VSIDLEQDLYYYIGPATTYRTLVKGALLAIPWASGLTEFLMYDIIGTGVSTRIRNCHVRKLTPKDKLKLLVGA
jgi:hypothetical protein